MRLWWTNEVPWNNQIFTIFRRKAFNGTYDSVGFSLKPGYTDRGLANGTMYYYKVRSKGGYSSAGFIDPIINFSQKTGAVPVDNDPPCPQVLSDSVICEKFINYLHWHNPGDTCGRDIAKYYIYFSPTSGTKPVLVDSILDPLDTVYVFKQTNSVVGCYSVIAVDSAGNRSDLSNTICIDYTACPLYSLPNFFSPNGDGINDFFVPITNSSVDHIDLKVFNRWGRIVFKTSDPAINWDGNDINSGSACSDGTYLYICDVYQISLTGIQQMTLQGSITLLR